MFKDKCSLLVRTKIKANHKIKREGKKRVALERVRLTRRCHSTVKYENGTAKQQKIKSLQY